MPVSIRCVAQTMSGGVKVPPISRRKPGGAPPISTIKASAGPSYGARRGRVFFGCAPSLFGCAPPCEDGGGGESKSSSPSRALPSRQPMSTPVGSAAPSFPSSPPPGCGGGGCGGGRRRVPRGRALALPGAKCCHLLGYTARRVQLGTLLATRLAVVAAVLSRPPIL